MNEEQQVAPSEAAAEGVSENTEALATTDTTEGQAEGQPAEGDAPEDKKSASQERRERRKAYEQHLRAELVKATEAARSAEARLGRIKAAAAASEQAPKESDFSDTLEYMAALGAYSSTRALDQRAERDADAEVTAAKQLAEALEAQRQAELHAQFEEDRAEARSRYADYEAVFASAIIPPHVAGLVLESTAPADLAYHLGKNPVLARQIAQMPATQAARELGRIEARLSHPQPKTQTSAPPPITPVRGGGTAARDPSTMTPAEYRKFRESGGRPG